MKKIIKKTLIMAVLIYLAVFAATFVVFYVIEKAHHASDDFTYRPGLVAKPKDRFKVTCGWKDMIEGPCDKKDSYGLLSREEIEWIMENKKVSKEEIIDFAKHHAEYRKEQNSRIEAAEGHPRKEYIKQINRLENVIKTLEE